MQDTFKNAAEAFVKQDLEGIRKFSGWFAKAVTINILNGNDEELKDLYKDAAYMRSDIEYVEPLSFTKDFYLGYCSAYENVARKIYEEDNGQSSIDFVVSKLPKLRLQQIISYLGKKTYAQQNELADFLDISPSHLWNILNNNSVKDLDLFSVRKIGRHVIYGLNNKGLQYYNDRIDKHKKKYSSQDIFNLLSFVANNYKSESGDIHEKPIIFDEELYELLYDFVVQKDWGRPKKVYANIYKEKEKKQYPEYSGYNISGQVSDSLIENAA